MVDMKIVYQTFDGTIFDTEIAAKDYEASYPVPLFVIVDDDPVILEILTYFLEKSRIYHLAFQDPLEAMNFISKNKIAHVFTDFHMKGYGMSGKWIKEICSQKGIPCSIVSCDEAFADISKNDFMDDCVRYMKA
jgi:FixJ family two-component response regulator